MLKKKTLYDLSILIILIPSLFTGVLLAETAAPTRSRLIVMADMGNEPDEEQQMAHLLMYANKVDLEGLIACSGKYLHADRTDSRTKTRPDLFHKLVNGYGEVVDNLKEHESGWPEVTYLRSIIAAGTDEYGIDAVKPGQSNEASKLIEAAILKDDPRPLYIVCNAGGNTLAQALVDLDENRTREQMDALCTRIIVFENGAQDNSGAWIAGRYPKIAWHRSNHQTYSYGGPGAATGPYAWEPFQRDPDGQNEWARKHIMSNHGALGALFPPRTMGNRLHFIEGGGTIPWMGLVNQGLTDPQHLCVGADGAVAFLAFDTKTLTLAMLTFARTRSVTTTSICSKPIRNRKSGPILYTANSSKGEACRCGVSAEPCSMIFKLAWIGA